MSGLGVLFSSGWSLEDTLDLTLPQLLFVVSCIVQHKAETLNIVGETVITALGGKAQKTKPRKKASPERQDAELLQSIHAAGFGIVDSPSASGTTK